MKTKYLFIFIFMFVLTACSADVHTEIIGKWKGKTVKQDFQFFSGGRVELKDLKHSTYKGTYTITDNNTLTCTFESFIFTKPVIMKAKIKGDKLILKDKKGREEVYIRKT